MLLNQQSQTKALAGQKNTAAERKKEKYGTAIPDGGAREMGSTEHTHTHTD